MLKKLPAKFLLLLLLCTPLEVVAQSVSISGDLSLGTGITGGKGNVGNIYKRTPISLSTAFSAYFDDDTSLIYSFEFITEIESRVSLGLVPKVKTRLDLNSELKLDFALGFHSKIAPYMLFGPQIDVNFIKFYKKFALYIKNQVLIFPWGNDLPEDKTIFEYNIFIGIAIPLIRYGI